MALTAPMTSWQYRQSVIAAIDEPRRTHLVVPSFFR
jgi:hypothetical protein